MSTQTITENIRGPNILNPFTRPRRASGIVSRRAFECIAISMIGDGLLAVIEPERHILLWRSGPRWWRKIMQPFVDNPTLTRCVGAAETAFGFWLASAQRP
ncbi:MAG TPA: hypothetical protein VHE81_15945 [Lacipirellulaceae bacterium]|nr:hypothetical protein [Lacipirellulaceae bacterium]